MGSLADQYRDLIAHRASHSIKKVVSGEGLTNFINHSPDIYRLELPHIFELIWMLNYPFRETLVSSNLRLGSSSLSKKVTFWSQTPTSCWMPNTQMEEPMLYQAFVRSASFEHIDIEAHKASEKAPDATCIMIPTNESVNRRYRANDNEINEVISKLQFPREFFEHKHDCEQFNKFSRRLRLDMLLTKRT